MPRRLRREVRLFASLPQAEQKELLSGVGVFVWDPSKCTPAEAPEIELAAENGSSDPETAEDSDDAPLTKLLKRTGFLTASERAVVPQEIHACLLTLELGAPVYSVDFGPLRAKPLALHAWGAPPGRSTHAHPFLQDGSLRFFRGLTSLSAIQRYSILEIQLPPSSAFERQNVPGGIPKKRRTLRQAAWWS